MNLKKQAIRNRLGHSGGKRHTSGGSGGVRVTSGGVRHEREPSYGGGGFRPQYGGAGLTRRKWEGRYGKALARISGLGTASGRSGR